MNNTNNAETNIVVNLSRYTELIATETKLCLIRDAWEEGVDEHTFKVLLEMAFSGTEKRPVNSGV